MNEEKKTTKKEKKLATVKRSQFNALTAIITFALGILVGYFVWGSDSADAPTQFQEAPLAAEAPQQAPAENVDIPTEGYPSQGPEDAPIVIVEFSDFECPFCTKWHNEVYKPLLEEYPDQIRLVYRNFPLVGLHANAYLAAEAVLCAGDQDSYWDYHEKLFENELGLREAALHEYAEQLELDADIFRECLVSGKYTEFVKNDIDYAMSIGVQSTPTFYVNGRAVIGAQPLSVFQSIIEEELAK